MSDSSRTRIIYKTEASFAETPGANPATTLLRFTSESLDHRNTTVISEEIRPDRQRSDLILTGYDAAGDINQELVYGGAFDTWIQAVLCGTWTSDVLHNGTTDRSFLIEKGFNDIAKFISLRGATLNQLSFDISSRKQVTFKTSWMAAQGYVSGTSVAGTTAPTAAIDNEVMRAGDLIALIDGGTSNIALNGEKVKRITFDVNNNLRPHELATAYQSDNFGRGVMNITGTLETYLTDSVIYGAMKSNSLCELCFTVKDPSLATNNAYKFLFPKIKLAQAPTPIGGVDSDVMEVVTWQALYDAGVGYTVEITRNLDL
jgi:hypothetical protein